MSRQTALPPDIARMLGLKDQDDGEPKVRPLPEAQISDLLDAYGSYSRSIKGCPFVAGDLVMARRGATIKHVGEPCIVLETVPVDDVYPDFQHITSPETGGSSFGRRLDMRILLVDDSGVRAPFWCESYEFEPYTGPGANGGDHKASQSA